MPEKPKTERQLVVDSLRSAEARMRERMPGNPALSIPLDKIYCYKNDDGELRAVINVQEVIYLADSLMAEKR